MTAGTTSAMRPEREGTSVPSPRRRGLTCLAAAALLANAQAPPSQHEESGADSGQRLFESYCSACHQYDRQGMGEAPPLDSSPWVAGPPERLIRIVLHGVEGRIEIEGKVYDREMPGFGGTLSDRQTAALATYARSRFGAGPEPVPVAEVRRVRQAHAGRTRYWPASKLLELR